MKSIKIKCINCLFAALACFFVFSMIVQLQSSALGVDTIAADKCNLNIPKHIDEGWSDE